MCCQFRPPVHVSWAHFPGLCRAVSRCVLESSPLALPADGDRSSPTDDDSAFRSLPTPCLAWHETCCQAQALENILDVVRVPPDSCHLLLELDRMACQVGAFESTRMVQALCLGVKCMRESLLSVQVKVASRAVIMQEHLGGQILPLYLFFKYSDSMKTGFCHFYSWFYPTCLEQYPAHGRHTHFGSRKPVWTLA